MSLFIFKNEKYNLLSVVQNISGWKQRDLNYVRGNKVTSPEIKLLQTSTLESSEHILPSYLEYSLPVSNLADRNYGQLKKIFIQGFKGNH